MGSLLWISQTAGGCSEEVTNLGRPRLFRLQGRVDSLLNPFSDFDEDVDKVGRAVGPQLPDLHRGHAQVLIQIDKSKNKNKIVYRIGR